MRSSVSDGWRARVSACARKYPRSTSLTCSNALKIVDLMAKGLADNCCAAKRDVRSRL